MSNATRNETEQVSPTSTTPPTTNETDPMVSTISPTPPTTPLAKVWDVLQLCADIVAEKEQTLPTSDRLHLLYESKNENIAVDSSNLVSPMELYVLHSRTVSFTNCKHAGPSMLSNGFALFHHNMATTVTQIPSFGSNVTGSNIHSTHSDKHSSTDNPSTNAVSSVIRNNVQEAPSTGNHSISVQDNVSDVGQNPAGCAANPVSDNTTPLASSEADIIAKFEAASERLMNENLFKWFPGAHEKLTDDKKSKGPSKADKSTHTDGESNGHDRSASEPVQTSMKVASNNRQVTSTREQGAENEESTPPSSETAVEENQNSPAVTTKKKKNKKKKLTARIEVDEILKVGGAIIAQLSTCKKEVISNIYKEFFLCLHDLILSSVYKKSLVSDRKWTARQAYQDFTAPWFKRTLSVNNDVVYLHPEGIRALPHQRVLRSNSGRKKILYILSAFYDNEPCIRDILRKIVYGNTKIILTLHPSSMSDRCVTAIPVSGPNPAVQPSVPSVPSVPDAERRDNDVQEIVPVPRLNPAPTVVQRTVPPPTPHTTSVPARRPPTTIVPAPKRLTTSVPPPTSIAPIPGTLKKSLPSSKRRENSQSTSLRSIAGNGASERSEDVAQQSLQHLSTPLLPELHHGDVELPTFQPPIETPPGRSPAIINNENSRSNDPFSMFDRDDSNSFLPVIYSDAIASSEAALRQSEPPIPRPSSDNQDKRMERGRDEVDKTNSPQRQYKGQPDNNTVALNRPSPPKKRRSARFGRTTRDSTGSTEDKRLENAAQNPKGRTEDEETTNVPSSPNGRQDISEASQPRKRTEPATRKNQVAENSKSIDGKRRHDAPDVSSTSETPTNFAAFNSSVRKSSVNKSSITKSISHSRSASAPDSVKKRDQQQEMRRQRNQRLLKNVQKKQTEAAVSQGIRTRSRGTEQNVQHSTEEKTVKRPSRKRKRVEKKKVTFADEPSEDPHAQDSNHEDNIQGKRFATRRSLRHVPHTRPCRENMPKATHNPDDINCCSKQYCQKEKGLSQDKDALTMECFFCKKYGHESCMTYYKKYFQRICIVCCFSKKVFFIRPRVSFTISEESMQDDVTTVFF